MRDDEKVKFPNTCYYCSALHENLKSGAQGSGHKGSSVLKSEI